MNGIQVWQVTEDPEGASLVYPDVPCFLRDGRSLVFHGPAGPMICYIDDHFAFRPVFEDNAHRQIMVSPDGRHGYYAACDHEGDGSLTLSRVDLETFRREDVFHATGHLPGTSIPAHKFGPRTISSDSHRVASTIFLGDGKTKDAPHGIVALDLDRGTACIAAEDRDFGNSHLQYCRSTDEEASHDLLIQMNHGSHSDKTGKHVISLGPPSEKGVDIHVVRDDGTNWRDLPWGRDGKESCIGHQMWRGRGRSAVTITLQNMDNSYGWADGTRQEVVEGWPIAADKTKEHRGRRRRGARRRVLSQGFSRPKFCHLGIDADGDTFVFDTFPVFDTVRAGMRIYIGRSRGEDAPLDIRYLVNSGVTFNGGRGYHAHPIVSPDGRAVFFNSDISGTKQVYMVTGVEYD